MDSSRSHRSKRVLYDSEILHVQDLRRNLIVLLFLYSQLKMYVQMEEKIENNIIQSKIIVMLIILHIFFHFVPTSIEFKLSTKYR